MRFPKAPDGFKWEIEKVDCKSYRTNLVRNNSVIPAYDILPTVWTNITEEKSDEEILEAICSDVDKVIQKSIKLEAESIRLTDLANQL